MIARVLLFVVIVASTSACTMGATNVWEGQVGEVPAESKPCLERVTMDYSTWAVPEVVEKLRPQEPEYRAAICRGFNDQLASGDAASDRRALPITITVTDINPGSRAKRYWVGFGAGKGYINAKITVGTLGTFMIRQAVVGGAFGGSFETNCEELGEATAHHVTLLIRGEKTPAKKR